MHWLVGSTVIWTILHQPDALNKLAPKYGSITSLILLAHLILQSMVLLTGKIYTQGCIKIMCHSTQNDTG